jgi:hypothetical protein
MIHAQIEQGSPEWRAIRAGKITGSRVDDMLNTIKSGAFAASRIDYAYDLALERLTGEPQGQDLSNVQWVQDGKIWEADARALYEFRFDIEVEQIGFATHNALPMFGASPDGLIGDDGVLEIKCPKAKTHLQYLLGKVAPADYLGQMDSEIACTNRKWCDFVSFNPKFPAHLQFFCVRYTPEPAKLRELEKAVIAFDAEVEAILVKLKAA